MILGFWYRWKYNRYRKQFTSKNLMKRFNKLMDKFPKKAYEFEMMQHEMKFLQKEIDEAIIRELAQQNNLKVSKE